MSSSSIARDELTIRDHVIWPRHPPAISARAISSRARKKPPLEMRIIVWRISRDIIGIPSNTPPPEIIIGFGYKCDISQIYLEWGNPKFSRYYFTRLSFHIRIQNGTGVDFARGFIIQ